MKATQAERLLYYLSLNPGASSLEITRDLGLVNVTGRISDLRASGNVIDAKRVNGIFRYYPRVPAQTNLGL